MSVFRLEQGDLRFRNKDPTADSRHGESLSLHQTPHGAFRYAPSSRKLAHIEQLAKWAISDGGHFFRAEAKGHRCLLLDNSGSRELSPAAQRPFMSIDDHSSVEAAGGPCRVPFDPEALEMEMVDIRALEALAPLLPNLRSEHFESGQWIDRGVNETGVMHLPYVQYSEDARGIVEDLWYVGWVLQDFDWQRWVWTPEGQSLLANKAALLTASEM